MRLALVLAVMLVPAVAVAGPITAGVNLGIDHSKEAAQSGTDASRTFGLFGRLGLTPRLSAQLEVSKIRSADESTEIRSVTGLLVVDLSSSATLVPVLLVGFGGDWSESSYGDCVVCAVDSTQSATHIEGGFGLEYRAPGGLTIGADVRMGGRSMDNHDVVIQDAPVRALYYPAGMREGEYRNARIRLGIRF